MQPFSATVPCSRRICCCFTRTNYACVECRCLYCCQASLIFNDGKLFSHSYFFFSLHFFVCLVREFLGKFCWIFGAVFTFSSTDNAEHGINANFTHCPRNNGRKQLGKVPYYFIFICFYVETLGQGTSIKWHSTLIGVLLCSAVTPESMTTKSIGTDNHQTKRNEPKEEMGK